MAKAIKDAVSIPVMAANLIRSPEQAEQQLKEGIQDFVSLGRPQIADPHWANKALNGGTIKRCICCLNCIESMQNNAYIGSHGECSVNPFVGHENEELKKDGNGRNVAVIGAGPAGLMASEILARRGFNVTLFEKNEQAGGQIILAAAPPKKDKTMWFVEDLVKTCENLGVSILLNTPATVEKIKALNPCAVIVATGSNPVKPKFNGNYDPDKVLTFEDVLSSKVNLENKKVALIGSGMTGLETAHTLVEGGCNVTVVEMAKEIAPGTWMQHKDDVMPHLEKANTRFMLGEKLCEIGNGYIVTENVKNKKTTKIDAEYVVLALGSKPDNELVNDLKSNGFNPFVIGDSSKVGRIADATKGAYKVAISIK